MIHTRPRATMRLQFHKEFTFADARGLVPYLATLGVSHLYASPILTAMPGSVHGYDVIDPTQLNPELGGEEAFRALVGALRGAGLGLIVDIVPNHMAVVGSQNRWWTDVLQHGKSSRYAKFFDIEWQPANPLLKDKVLAPFLGDSYGDALDKGDIRLKQDAAGNPIVAYFDNQFPINPSEYAHIEEIGLESFDPSHSSGQTLLDQLLNRQHYRLAWWGTAGDEINWRRFFDINGLAGLKAELPEVFEATHATLFRLYKDGLIDGFRIDHVDGLAEPREYCRRLRARLAELAPSRPSGAAQGPAYIIVEKILGAGEELPRDWDVDGTSGYDFMNDVSALQHDAKSQHALERVWHELARRAAHFEAEEVTARQEILDSSFDAQLHSVATGLHQIAIADRHTRDMSLQQIRRGLTEILVSFPVYRTYGAGVQRSGYDQVAFDIALEGARRRAHPSLLPVIDQLDKWLGAAPYDGEAYKAAQRRFQQLSAPIAAKAVEDTAFYRYGRLLSRNDVGFDAARLGFSIPDFHQACLRRQSAFPNAMLATATHDHKRGEDVRARLAVLSELPDEWADLVRRCMAMEADRPAPADEIMLYQMIVGAWPLKLEPTDAQGCDAFRDRIVAWQ
ncbi:MAG TPA: malto-oligosyltrehalose synthase, partial [Edaphobacter sp.]|nr:malto-oligosyltrehalose synthase [Edaphobacter sp.]